MNDRVNILQGKKILIFPDVDAYDYWKEKFKARHELVEDLDLEIKSVTVPPRANALPTDASGSTSTTVRLPEPWWNTSSCAAMTPNSWSLKKRTSRSKNAYAGPTNGSANYFKRSRSVPRPKPTSVFICCSTIFRNNISLCSFKHR